MPGLFTSRAVDIALLYTGSNSNTRGPLAVTMALNSESSDFNCHGQ